jgi:hypothetical protein
VNDTVVVALTEAYNFNVSECRDLTEAGVHTLTANFSGPGTCLIISGDDIVLNGYGYTVTSSTTGNFPVVSITGDNVTINGGTYSGGSAVYRGVQATGADNLTINDANMNGQYYGCDTNGAITNLVINNATTSTTANGQCSYRCWRRY